ncbi:hypothetical protein T06_923 [Trichinella sp. T6]|nr:hypothetical protein T06_923 [Trichinella sp. T6]
MINCFIDSNAGKIQHLSNKIVELLRFRVLNLLLKNLKAFIQTICSSIVHEAVTFLENHSNISKPTNRNLILIFSIVGHFLKLKFIASSQSVHFLVEDALTPTASRKWNPYFD